MLRRIIYAGVTVMLGSAIACACINEFDQPETEKSHRHQIAFHGVPAAIPVDEVEYQRQIQTLTPAIEKSPDYRQISDLAVAHLYVGETKRAIELLHQAEELKPGEYVIAGNLGTAYELDGRNEEALKWIEEGLRRNPESHDGSEWIHANLLRAKIEMARNPGWLLDSKNSVTGLEFGDGALPVFDSSASAPNCPKIVADIARHLSHQLFERRQFIPGPDPIVAALMFDLANAIVLASPDVDAKPIYVAARGLGYHDLGLANRRIDAIQPLGWWLIVWGIGLLLTVGCLAILALRLLRRQRPTGLARHSEATA